MSVVINSPKTPVTKGSNGIAMATVPNICKMPGPPAPFVPAPLPNIGRSSLSPKGYSKKVKIKKKPVAIKGATFASQGDVASKATGGGMVSANTHGPTKFVGPGALDVKIEGKNVQLLSDPMLNNCGPSGNPPNSATLQGVVQSATVTALVGDEICPLCDEAHGHDRSIRETSSTKGVCDELQEALGTGGKIKMVGAVECVDKEYYVAQSGGAHTGKLADAVKARNDRAPNRKNKKKKPKWHQVKAPITDLASHITDPQKKKAFEVGLQRVQTDYQEWQDAEKDKEVPRYPPGNCAGQQAMLLALDHGGRPTGMTERFHNSGKGGTTKVYVRRGSPRAKPKPGDFGGSQAVPPCETCVAILTMLMCNQKERKCNHVTSKSCDAC